MLNGYKPCTYGYKIFCLSTVVHMTGILITYVRYGDGIQLSTVGKVEKRKLQITKLCKLNHQLGNSLSKKVEISSTCTRDYWYLPRDSRTNLTRTSAYSSPCYQNNFQRSW